MHRTLKDKKDGWLDNLSEQLQQMDEDRMREVYVQFREGLRLGHTLTELQLEFSLTRQQVKTINRRIETGKFNTGTMRGDL